MASITRLHPAARYSEAAIHHGTVYLSGQVPDDTTQDIRGQTAQVLAMVDRLLHEAGSHRSLILTAQIFLADLADYDGMNAIWDAWIDPANPPCRATVQAQLAKPEWRIEVVVTAAVKG